MDLHWQLFLIPLPVEALTMKAPLYLPPVCDCSLLSVSFVPVCGDSAAVELHPVDGPRGIVVVAPIPLHTLRGEGRVLVVVHDMLCNFSVAFCVY